MLALDNITEILNGYIMPFLLVLCGVILAVKIRLFKILSPKNFFVTLSTSQEKNGTSPMKAMCTALAGTLGVGNIAGVATALSAGGAGALMYTVDGKHRACACAVSGPACDLMSMSRDFPDGVCSVYRAVAHYDMPFEDAVKRISPLYQVGRMPKIPYFIAHTDADEIIRIEKNSGPFVEQLRAHGHDVTYVVVPGQAHCDLGPEAQAEFDRFVFDHGGGKEV